MGLRGAEQANDKQRYIPYLCTEPRILHVNYQPGPSAIRVLHNIHPMRLKIFMGFGSEKLL